MEKLSAILSGLAIDKEKISALYGAYEKLLPELADLWAGLAAEEKEHARTLRDLSYVLENRDEDAHFTAAGVHNEHCCREFLDYELKKALSGDTTAKHAIKTAIKIEDEILEKCIFSYLNANDEDLAEIFGRLRDDNRRHSETLREFAESL